MKIIYWNSSILWIVILAYLPFGIVLPIYATDANYASSMIILFWLPCLFMFGINFCWMNAKNIILPFAITNILTATLSFYFEFSSLGLNIWNFSEEHHKLLGISIYNAPIEEFLFWWGATPFCQLLYTCFYRLIRKNEVSKEFLWTAAWPAILLPFIPIVFWLFKKIRKENIVSWGAIVIVVAYFWLTLTFVECNALQKGHWVYNDHRIFGLKIFGIPIEEYLYYTLGPIFAVLLLHFFELRPMVVFNGRRSTNDLMHISLNITTIFKTIFKKLLCQAYTKKIFNSNVDRHNEIYSTKEITKNE